MECKLRDYIENLFAAAPKTKQAYELKEEIIRNTIERYHDLINEGKSESEAYNLAIAGIGDINELLSVLDGFEAKVAPQYTQEEIFTLNRRSSFFKSIAVALYILCVIPAILFSFTSVPTIGAAFMFLMVSTATGLLVYQKKTKFLPLMTQADEISQVKKYAIMRAVGVGLYISCVVPCILLFETPLADISAIFIFILIAGATVLMIVSRKPKTYTKTDDTMVENFKEWNSRKKATSGLYKGLVAVLWGLASLIYLFVTLYSIFAGSIFVCTISWIIFLIAVALQNLMRAIFDYVEASK